MSAPTRLPITLKDVQDTLRLFGICLKEDQITAVDQLIKGKDIMVTLPTGYGKSMIFLCILLTLLKKKVGFFAMLVTPLLGLSENHKSSLKKMNIPYFDINNMDGDENASVLISNPEGYLSQIGIQMIKEKQSSINLLIVDEVHTIYLWGLSEKNEEKAFRADFGKLDNVIGRLRVKPLIVTLTATISPQHRTQVVDMLGIRVDNCYSIERAPLNPRISFVNLPGTLNLLNLGMFIRTKGQETPRMVIYITKMDDCGDVFDALKQIVGREHEHRIEAMNGRTDPDLKKEIVQRLLNADDDLKIVVCTAVLSMGIDMAGRCGRSPSLRAVCLTMGRCSRYGSELVKGYTTNTLECRRKYVSRVFGDPLPHDNASNIGCCDICDPTTLDDPMVKELISPPASRANTPLFAEEDIKREVYPIDKKDFLIGLKQLNDEIRQREQANLNIAFTTLSPKCNRKSVAKWLGYIGSIDDIQKILPTLNREVANRILKVVSELYEDEEFPLDLEAVTLNDPVRFPGDEVEMDVDQDQEGCERETEDDSEFDERRFDFDFESNDWLN